MRTRVRLGAFAILIAAIIYIDWYGDMIGHDSARYGADKFPSGFGFYCIPAAFLLGCLAALVLLVDALIVSARWMTRRFARKEK
jgi:hypothetical protein